MITRRRLFALAAAAPAVPIAAMLPKAPEVVVGWDFAKRTTLRVGPMTAQRVYVQALKLAQEAYFRAEERAPDVYVGRM